MLVEAVHRLVIHSFLESSELQSQLVARCSDATVRAILAIHTCLEHGNKVLIFGNGGSAADAQHIAAELVGRFRLERNPLPAIALTADSSVLTAVGNDYGFDQVFARQIFALGKPGDVALAISASGRSPNVLAGVAAAGKQAMTTVGLTGGNRGSLANMVDIPVVVPSVNTARVQECQITIGHIICEVVESLLASTKSDGE